MKRIQLILTINHCIVVHIFTKYLEYQRLGPYDNAVLLRFHFWQNAYRVPEVWIRRHFPLYDVMFFVYFCLKIMLGRSDPGTCSYTEYYRSTWSSHFSLISLKPNVFFLPSTITNWLLGVRGTFPHFYIFPLEAAEARGGVIARVMWWVPSAVCIAQEGDHVGKVM